MLPCCASLWPCLLQTKRLLETGSVLRPSLVLQLLEDVSSLATRSGLNKQPAPFLLPLFTFMRKCVGLEEHTFFRQCQRLGCGPLIYGAEELSRQEQVPGSQVRVLSGVTSRGSTRGSRLPVQHPVR